MYECDVFISYRRANPVKSWVTGILAPILREWLPEALGRDAEVFLDETSIEPGLFWPDELAEKLVRSRCVLPVLNPGYFQRPWCLAEFETMLARQEAAGNNSVVPVQFSDGEHFDPRAADLQWVRMEEFNRLPTKHRALHHMTFMRSVQDLCGILSKRIKAAPPFDPAWHTLVVRPHASPAKLAVPGFGGVS